MIELDISVEAAMTLIMSAGMVQPGSDDAQKKLRRARGERAARSRATPAPPTAPAK